MRSPSCASPFRRRDDVSSLLRGVAPRSAVSSASDSLNRHNSKDGLADRSERYATDRSRSAQLGGSTGGLCERDAGRSLAVMDTCASFLPDFSQVAADGLGGGPDKPALTCTIRTQADASTRVNGLLSPARLPIPPSRLA